MLNIFPRTCYFSFQFSKETTITWKNFYQANLENYINKILVWSESQLKLSSLVSWCADFTRFKSMWPIQVMNQWCFGFFEEKARRYEHQLSWITSSALVAWTWLVCLKAGPTLLAPDWSNTTGDSVLRKLDQSEQRGLEFWASF